MISYKFLYYKKKKKMCALVGFLLPYQVIFSR